MYYLYPSKIQIPNTFEHFFTFSNTYLELKREKKLFLF